MKNILITGANRGLGLAHTECFAKRGIHVFACTRDPASSTDLQDLSRVHPGCITVLQYDATDVQTLIQLIQDVDGTPLDLLLLNAGIIGSYTSNFNTADHVSIMNVVQVNALAPLRLAQALLSNVERSNRRIVAFQSSLMGSIGENKTGGLWQYRISKSVLNMIARSAAAELRHRHITVVALNPGWSRTRMGGANAPLLVEESVAGQQRVLENLSILDTGTFINYDGQTLPW